MRMPEKIELARAREFAEDPSQWLVVYGGGTKIDAAKGWKLDTGARVKLVAIPTLWGSGAEVSPVVVRNRDGRKHIQISDDAIPDCWAEWPEALQQVPADLARYACGDVWAHALEASVSPLANADIKASAAALIEQMMDLPLSYHPDWLSVSQQACRLQAQSGVGLVHGIAHVLEDKLTGWGHARLCSLYLYPVLTYNKKAVPDHVHQLFQPDEYRSLLPTLREAWPEILRDPCTRVNATLVRPSAIDFFEAL